MIGFIIGLVVGVCGAFVIQAAKDSYDREWNEQEKDR